MYQVIKRNKLADFAPKQVWGKEKIKKNLKFEKKNGKKYYANLYTTSIISY